MCEDVQMTVCVCDVRWRVCVRQCICILSAINLPGGNSPWSHLKKKKKKNPELSGCITTLMPTVRNTGGCKLLCSNGHLDRSRWRALWFVVFDYTWSQ